MKVRAIVSVINSDTGLSVPAGDVFDIPEDRALNAVNAGLCELVDQEEKKAAKAPAKKSATSKGVAKK